jgi:hypothetical protein
MCGYTLYSCLKKEKMKPVETIPGVGRQDKGE